MICKVKVNMSQSGLSGRCFKNGDKNYSEFEKLESRAEL